MSGGAFGEPWEVTHDPNYCPRTCRQVWTARGFGVGGACGCNALFTHDYGARIVACVNACAGLADPSVVPELVEVLRPFAEALDRAERNGARLVGVLCQWMEPGAEREYVGSTSTCGPDDFERARALLARIGGEA